MIVSRKVTVRHDQHSDILLMRKIFLKIHLWLSVPFGLIITLVCFSGAMLVFEKEISEAASRKMYFTGVPEDSRQVTLTVDSAAAIVRSTLPEGIGVTGVTVSSDPERTWKVGLSKPRRAAVYVDQYTGQITGRYERAPFFSFMFRLHRWLLDSMKPGETVFWGKLIVGTSTLMLVIVLVSGAVIWWPRTRKALSGRLKVNVRRGWKKFLYDLHVAGGIYAFVFLLALALTGLTWSFQWYRTGFYSLFGAESASGTSSDHGLHALGSDASAAVTDIWDKVVKNLAGKNPGYASITVSDGSASVSFGRLGNRRAADRYVFDPSTGEITGAALYKDAARTAKVSGWVYSVHTGSWGGVLTKVLTFLAALLGATLPLTGYWMWLKKRRIRHQQHRIHHQ